MRVVQRAATRARNVAQPDIAARFFKQHIGKIFGTHGRQFVGNDLGFTNQSSRNFLTEARLRWRVHSRWVTLFEAYLYLSTEGGGNPRADVLNPLLDELLDRWFEGADGAAQYGVFRNYIPGIAGMNGVKVA